MSFKGRDIISIRDFSKTDVEHVFEVTRQMELLAAQGSTLLDYKTLAYLFFEPSTRTRLSFEAAMNRLGGKCIGISEPKTSSIEKGESLEDMIRVIENYSDVIVLRHPSDDAAKVAAEYSSIPVINAGSGTGEHPTQAFLDLYTIKREFGKIDDLNIALLGDLKHGRTGHSLAYALTYYNVNVFLVSPKLLRMPKKILDDICRQIRVVEVNNVEDIMSKLDVLYVTRMQKERFADLTQYASLRGSYSIDLNSLRNAKKNLIIMHPLPRNDEIASEVDSTPYARYFKQVWFGLVTRMACLALILGAFE